MSNIVYEKAVAFGDRMVLLEKFLKEQKHEFILSKQIVRSGTSISANLAESKFGLSKAEFIHRIKISLREANETKLWIRFLTTGQYITPYQAESLTKDLSEIIYLLISIIKSHNKQL